MRGYDKYNFPAFDKAAAGLRAIGWNVISPAEMDREAGFDENKNQEITPEMMDDFFDRDVAAIRKSHAIYLLKGWQESKGAVAERHLALWRNLKIIEECTESILQEAQRITTGSRQNAYGHPYEDFSRTGKIWSAILGFYVSPRQVSLCMVGLKVSRECNKPSRDNRVDGAGYFNTLDMVDDHESKIEKLLP